MKVQEQININAYKAEGFIGNYQKLVRETVIPYQYKILKDEVEGAEKSHVYANFQNAAKKLKSGDAGDGFYGMVFQDSDAAKRQRHIHLQTAPMRNWRKNLTILLM